MLDTLISGFASLGLLVVLTSLIYVAFHIIQGIRVHLVLNVIPFTTKFGKWAVVTGCTDGIGRAYAIELAKRGVNIVLISRSQEKLDRVAEEIRKNFFVQTKTITVDFSEGSKVFEKIEKGLIDIEVGILVNNVGKQYDHPMFLSEVPEKELWDIININVGATTMMTRLVLPEMVERGRGAIVNVSSGSELQPLPLMTVYAATKTFIHSFTAALRCEYRAKGITVQHLTPFFVNTKMNSFSEHLQKTSIIVPDAATYSASAVNTLGRLDHSAGYWSHGVQEFVTYLFPVFVRTYVGYSLNSFFKKEYKVPKKIKDN